MFAVLAWIISRLGRPAIHTAQQAVIEASRRFGISERIPLAIMQVESSGRDPERVGPAGEIGIMQVTPPAMETTGYYLDLDSSLYEQAISGVAYFRHLQLLGNGDWFAIRAYNVGPGGAEQGRGYGYLTKVLARMYF